VRRADKSDYASDGWNNCLLDLSSLDATKNIILNLQTILRTKTMIPNVCIIPQSEYDGITSVDRATLITLSGSFKVYVKPKPQLRSVRAANHSPHADRLFWIHFFFMKKAYHLPKIHGIISLMEKHGHRFEMNGYPIAERGAS
jgi:hypothetical protein